MNEMNLKRLQKGTCYTAWSYSRGIVRPKWPKTYFSTAQSMH